MSFVDQVPNGEFYGSQDVMVVDWFQMAASSLTLVPGLAFYAYPGALGESGNGGLNLFAPYPGRNVINTDGTGCTGTGRRRSAKLHTQQS